jgi:hypothetical protein
MADVFDGEAPTDTRRRLWDLIRATPFLDWQILTKRPGNFRRFLPKDWGDGYSNVWLGVTAENRKDALLRIPILQSTPAAIRFVSGEPLLEDLGDLDLTGIDWMIVGGESGRKARPFDVTWATGLIERCKLQRVKVFMKQLGRKPPEHERLCICPIRSRLPSVRAPRRITCPSPSVSADNPRAGPMSVSVGSIRSNSLDLGGDDACYGFQMLGHMQPGWFSLQRTLTGSFQ